MSLVESRKKGLEQNKERKEELKRLHEQLCGSVGIVGDHLKKISDFHLAPIVETQVALFEGFKENAQIFSNVLSELKELRKDMNVHASKLDIIERLMKSHPQVGPVEPAQRAEIILDQVRQVSENVSQLHVRDEGGVDMESEAHEDVDMESEAHEEIQTSQFDVTSVNESRILISTPKKTEIVAPPSTNSNNVGRKRKRDMASVDVEKENELPIDSVNSPEAPKEVENSKKEKKMKKATKPRIVNKKQLHAEFQKRFLDAARNTCRPKLPIKLGDCVITAMWNKGDPENADPEHIRQTIEKQAQKYREKSGFDVEVISTSVSSEIQFPEPKQTGEEKGNKDEVLLSKARIAVQEAVSREKDGRMTGKSFTEKMIQAKAKKAAEKQCVHQEKAKVEAEKASKAKVETEKASKAKFETEKASKATDDEDSDSYEEDSELETITDTSDDMSEDESDLSSGEDMDDSAEESYDSDDGCMDEEEDEDD